MVALYKLLTGKFRDLDPTEFVEFASGNTRGHPLKIAKPILKTHMRNFLPFRVMNVWNALPIEVVQRPTVSSFKKALKGHMNLINNHVNAINDKLLK